MDLHSSDHPRQDHAAYQAGQHDFQSDIQRLAENELVGTILETVMLATRMRSIDMIKAAPAYAANLPQLFSVECWGDEIEIGSTFCQTVRKTSEMIIFNEASSDPVYRDHPIAAAFGIVSYASVPIFRGDGSFFGTLCAIDTETKDVNNARTVAMLKMFATIIGGTLDTAERLDAQERMIEQERMLVRIQEEFTAILGHDLRNPVTALRSGIRMLGKEPLTERGRGLIGLMQSSLHRMGELVENMMLHAKARLGDGITVAATPDAPLGDAIAQVVAEIRLAAPRHRADPRGRPTRHLSAVPAGPDRRKFRAGPGPAHRVVHRAGAWRHDRRRLRGRHDDFQPDLSGPARLTARAIRNGCPPSPRSAILPSDAIASRDDR